MISIHKNNIVCGYLFGKFSVCILAVMLLCKINGQAGHSGKGEKTFFMKGENIKEKVVFNIKKNFSV